MRKTEKLSSMKRTNRTSIEPTEALRNLQVSLTVEVGPRVVVEPDGVAVAGDRVDAVQVANRDNIV